MTTEELLTIAEAARRLGCSRQNVEALIERGHLEGVELKDWRGPEITGVTKASVARWHDEGGRWQTRSPGVGYRLLSQVAVEQGTDPSGARRRAREGLIPEAIQDEQGRWIVPWGTNVGPRERTGA